MRKDKERFYKRAIGNILLLSLIPTYKDEPSAHGRCELEARRSVHPERMQVGALTSIWQVGVPPAEAQGVDSANSLFDKNREATQPVIPSDSHSGFYFPLFASKDRVVNSMEIKDFIILWTYSQSDDSDGQTESLWGFLSD